MAMFSSKKMSNNKNILKYIHYDIKNFFNDDCYELYNEESIATIMVVYEKTVKQLEFDVFDKIQFQIFFDKENIHTESYINIKFLSSQKTQSKEVAERLVNKLLKIYNIDDDKKGKWNNNDDVDLKNCSFKRKWTVGAGDSFVSIINKDNCGITLNILFANNLVEFKQKNNGI